MAFITTHLRENKWGWGDKTHTSREDTHQLKLSKDLECYIKKEIISTELHYYHGTVKLGRVIKLTRKESVETKV